MSKVEMSIAEGLVRKKTLEKQIRSLVSIIDDNILTNKRTSTNTLYCNYKIGADSDKVRSGNQTVDEFTRDCGANLKKTEALIKNYEKLCKAINLANLTTKVKIGNEEMTISEAIALKSNPIIALRKSLINKLTTDYNAITNTVANYNAQYTGDEQFNEYVTAIYGDKASDQNMEEVEKKFHELRDAVIVDPMNCMAIVESLSASTNAFSDEVDYRLSEVNAKTMITVEFDD